MRKRSGSFAGGVHTGRAESKADQVKQPGETHRVEEERLDALCPKQTESLGQREHRVPKTGNRRQSLGYLLRTGGDAVVQHQASLTERRGDGQGQKKERAFGQQRPVPPRSSTPLRL